MATPRPHVHFCWLVTLVVVTGAAQLLPTKAEPVVQDVRIQCNSNDMVVAINTAGYFDGMVYPRGLAKNSSCLHEYKQDKGPVQYRLPLRSCNTMSTDMDDGIEYFNTVVVQPHRKLVTNQGRGYHVRCRYQTRDKVINSHMNVSMLDATPLTATAPLPGCIMRIFAGDGSEHRIAEEVRIGDPLTLSIALDQQEVYGLRVTDCVVRDGLGWGEQKLIDSDGCPMDPEIMGPFNYTEDHTEATVNFQAHKFPYTASVYYQCNVRLCLRADEGCPPLPDCSANTLIERRRRRQAKSDDKEREATIEVFSGLYVNEAGELGEADVTSSDVSQEPARDPDTYCVSQRSFAVAIAVAGLILMLCVVAALLCLLSRRRNKKGSSTTGSSIYSGPYTNTAYSHSS